MFRRLTLILAALILLPACWGKNLLIGNYSFYSGAGTLYHYNGTNWTGFTAALNAAFGAGNITINSNPLNDANALAGVDAIMIQMRNGGDTFSAAEITALQSFIASGRRILIFGENNNWTTWDGSIMTLVGGAYSGTEITGALTISVNNSITSGVVGLNATSDGIATGGTALFSPNVLTLWGTNQNALTSLSLNVVDDNYGNAQLRTNIATWLAGGPSGTSAPPPASVPALSDWGLVLLAVLLIATATGMIARRPAGARS